MDPPAQCIGWPFKPIGHAKSSSGQLRTVPRQRSASGRAARCRSRRRMRWPSCWRRELDSYPSQLEAVMPNKKAVIETKKGTIEVELFADEVPNTVANFEKLANSQFYDGTKFHRVIPNFMVQGGDPYSKSGKGPVGTGGPGYTIKCETQKKTHKHHPRPPSMGTAGHGTAGSQFFICHAPQRHLDGVHTVFGQVTKGMDVVNAIKGDDEITSIRVS